MKRIMTSLIWILLIGLSLVSSGQSNKAAIKFDKKEIDKYIKAEIKNGQIPGLTYAVVLNGKIVDSGAYGFANVELQSPVSIHTKFNLGSIGKTFTATAVMLLAKEGKLSIDDPITDYLDSLPETWRLITIRQMLNHTSGIKDYIQEFPPYSIIEKIDRKQNYAESDFIHFASELPLNFPPGDRFAYSNSNFVLLGFIVHKVSGKTLPQFMKEQVFTPLDMNETVYMKQTDIIANRAHGYRLNENKELINGRYISDFFSSTGDMGVTTTAGDMIKWSIALDNGKILDKETLTKMWTPGKLNNGAETGYGFGWELSDYRGYKIIEHAGSFLNGYTANYSRFTDFNLAVAVLRNLNPAKIDPRKIAGFFVPELTEDIGNIKPVANSDTSLVENVRLLFKQIMDDKVDTSLVTPDFKRNIDSIIKTIPKDVIVKNYISSDLVANRKLILLNSPIEKINYFKLEFYGSTFYLSLYITGDNKIASWAFYE